MTCFNFIKSTLFFSLLIFAFSVTANVLPNSDLTKLDDSVWHLVEIQSPIDAKQLIPALQQASKPVKSLLGKSGGALTKLPIKALNSGVWYVLPIANFVDNGQAFWQDESGEITEIANFSQSQHFNNTVLMHGQAFKLNIDKPRSGTLWIYLEAKHYPTPVHLSIVANKQFIQQQFLVNSSTIATIFVMLTLALMALLLYLKTKQKVALFCCGYIGLHAIGWAFAAGVIQSSYPLLPLNTTYAGMYLFPFAIACASYFAYYLFNFDQSEDNKSRFLIYYAKVALCLGLLMWFLPFTVVFYLSHLLASIWVVLSLYVGYKMLPSNDFRANYFFIGNLIYSVSLIFYTLSHFAIINNHSPEMIVLIALSIDCVCILSSLSEWFKVKHQELETVMWQARFDPLTKVGNRLLLNEHIEGLATDYLIVFIDCDGMKLLNDQLGHTEGDIFLSHVANLMKQKLKGLGEVYRTGGDEFIWLCKVKHNANLTNFKDTIKQQLNEVNALIKKRWPQSGISYGIATNLESDSTHHCLSLADSRMYEYKSSHKAKHCPQSSH